MPFEPLSRRDLLAGFFAAGFTGITKPLLAAQEGATLCFFSDSHVSLARNIKECRAMLDEIRLAPPKLALNGGDVVDYGWKGEYDRYDELTKALPWKTVHIPGNHDVRWSPLGLKIFQERVGPAYSAFDFEGVRFYALDSTVPLSHWGHFEMEMLRWLERDLEKVGRTQPVVIATHHWVGRDQVMVDNEEALRQILEPYNVKLILTGHGHNDLLWRWDGIPCTMNKGLYQGSYQRLDIDRDRSELRLFKRTTEKHLHLLAGIPLAAERAKQPAYAIRFEGTPEEPVVRVPGDQKLQARWNEGAWVAIGTEGVTAPPPIPGTHALALRKGQQGRLRTVRVERKGGTIRPGASSTLSGGVLSHLKLDEEHVFASCLDGSVVAMRQGDLKTVWRTRLAGYCHSSPVLDGPDLIVGASDGSVALMRKDTGAVRWKHMTDGPVYASGCFANGLVIVASGDGTIRGLDRESGKSLWLYRLPPSDTAFVQSHLATDGVRVFAGCWDKHLVALDVRTGKLLWRQACTDRTFAFSPAIGGPALGAGKVVVPANGNELYAFEAESGKLMWKATAAGDKFGYSSPRIRDGRITIGCLGGKGQVRCLNLEDGKELWCAETGADIYDSSPALGDDFLAIGCVNGILSAVSLADGKVLGQYRQPAGHVLCSPVARGRTVWSANLTGQVFRFEVRVS